MMEKCWQRLVDIQTDIKGDRGNDREAVRKFKTSKILTIVKSIFIAPLKTRLYDALKRNMTGY